MKKEYEFKLNSIESVKDFVNLASRVSADISIYSGRYIINGKSIMGIFSLDLTKVLNCSIEGSCEDIETFELGIKSMKLI